MRRPRQGRLGSLGYTLNALNDSRLHPHPGHGPHRRRLCRGGARHCLAHGALPPGRVQGLAVRVRGAARGDARDRYSVRFYVVAMLFIVFDLETVFLYPWAVIFKQEPVFYLLEMLVFLAFSWSATSMYGAWAPRLEHAARANHVGERAGNGKTERGMTPRVTRGEGILR